MDSGKKALLVVDVQNDFISGSLSLSKCAAKHDGSEVVPVINDLLDSALFDVIIYTQDWHPANHISFVDNVRNFQLIKPAAADEVKCFDMVTFNVESNPVRQILWPPHCVQNTWGSQFHEGLQIVPEALFVRKGTEIEFDSYSAFWNNVGSHCSELHDLLTQLDVTDVYIAGLAFDYCVGCTALDSRKLNYRTTVIEDACRSVDLNSAEDMRTQLLNAGTLICSSAAVKAALNGTLSR